MCIPMYPETTTFGHLVQTETVINARQANHRPAVFTELLSHQHHSPAFRQSPRTRSWHGDWLNKLPLLVLDPLGKEALSNHRCKQEVRQPGKNVGTLVPEMMFELVGGAFVGLSIPTILFGLGIYPGSLKPLLKPSTQHQPWLTVGRLCRTLWQESALSRSIWRHLEAKKMLSCWFLSNGSQTHLTISITPKCHLATCFTLSVSLPFR